MKVALPKKPRVVQISKTAQLKIKQAALYLKEKYGNIDSTLLRQMLHKEAALLLPDELYLELVSFREAFGYKCYGAIVLKGVWDVNQNLMGPTPPRWQEAKKVAEIELMEFAFALVHGALGSHMMQYRCQRGGGGYTHQVIPDKKMQKTQTGSGSTEDLTIHGEDVGLKTSAEFLSLFWIRNFEKAPSYLSSVRSIDWFENEKWEKILRKPIFTFFPDANYSYNNDILNFLRANKMPILFGNDTYPWFRPDNVEMIGKQETQEAEDALLWLEEQIQANIYKDFTPEAGDMLIVNNKMCGHGRGKFVAGFAPDGSPVQSRWALRMLSHTSPISCYEFGHPENQYLNDEILAGYHYSQLEKFLIRL